MITQHRCFLIYLITFVMFLFSSPLFHSSLFENDYSYMAFTATLGSSHHCVSFPGKVLMHPHSATSPVAFRDFSPCTSSLLSPMLRVQLDSAVAHMIAPAVSSAAYAARSVHLMRPQGRWDGWRLETCYTLKQEAAGHWNFCREYMLRPGA